jgi:hypothetical protein
MHNPGHWGPLMHQLQRSQAMSTTMKIDMHTVPLDELPAQFCSKLGGIS